MKKPLRTITWPVLLFGNALLLAGCAENGTSSATFSPDEDALTPKPEVARLTTGPLYGSTDPMPHPVADNSTHFSPEHTEMLNLGTRSRTAPEDDTASPDTESSTYDFDNLEVDSPDLKGKLAVLRVGSERSDSNLLTVFTGLKNKSANSLPIEVETVYKDKSDHPLSDGRASWIGITLKPHEETQYRSVALSEDATDFMVRIRRAQQTDNP
jgi:hypothetical protein